MVTQVTPNNYQKGFFPPSYVVSRATYRPTTNYIGLDDQDKNKDQIGGMTNSIG